MKTKIAIITLALISSAALITGCATSNQLDAGGMGNDYETGGGHGGSTSDYLNTTTTAPNGSITFANPFGQSTSGH